jgi:hypothetical protein
MEAAWSEVDAWTVARNHAAVAVDWRVTAENAGVKLKQLPAYIMLKEY